MGTRQMDSSVTNSFADESMRQSVSTDTHTPSSAPHLSSHHHTQVDDAAYARGRSIRRDSSIQRDHDQTPQYSASSSASVQDMQISRPAPYSYMDRKAQRESHSGTNEVHPSVDDQYGDVGVQDRDRRSLAPLSSSSMAATATIHHTQAVRLKISS